MGRKNRYIQGVLALLAISSFCAADTSVLVIQGLAGEDYYQRHFDEQTEKLVEASAKLADEDSIHIFAGQSATRVSILDGLKTALGSVDTEDVVLIYLVGHGSYDGREYKFNIAGPDLTGSELIDVIETSAAKKPLVVINTSSSSGALLEPFEETAIHLVTATKSGAERTATRFGRHFAEGLVEGSADLNKNLSISLQEAFDFAVRETENFFESEGLLATETARLQMSDQGASTDANLIRLSNLVERPDELTNPELAALYDQRDELDRQIDALRLRRIGMTEEDYLRRFQNLMVELSIIQLQIDAEEGLE